MYIFVKIYPASNFTGVFRQKPQGGGFFLLLLASPQTSMNQLKSRYISNFKVYYVQ